MTRRSPLAGNGAPSRTRNGDDGEEYRIAEPKPLLGAVERLLAAAAEADLGAYPATQDFLYDCFRFQEGSRWRGRGARGAVPSHEKTQNYCDLLTTDRRNIEARMVCLSPGEHIDAVLRGYHGAVRFSGTVSPLPLFQVIHGQDESSRAGRVRLDWGANLGVFIVGDVSTYYRDRTDSRDALVRSRGGT